MNRQSTSAAIDITGSSNQRERTSSASIEDGSMMERFGSKKNFDNDDDYESDFDMMEDTV
jgi:hypothetical protein